MVIQSLSPDWGSSQGGGMELKDLSMKFYSLQIHQMVSARYRLHLTVIGPLLFLLFVNNLSDFHNALTLLFEGHVKMVARRTENMSLHSPLTATWDWSKKWDLPINLTKCKNWARSSPEIAFFPEGSGTAIPVSKLVKQIGESLNKSLSPSPHWLNTHFPMSQLPPPQSHLQTDHYQLKRSQYKFRIIGSLPVIKILNASHKKRCFLPSLTRNSPLKKRIMCVIRHPKCTTWFASGVF